MGETVKRHLPQTAKKYYRLFPLPDAAGADPKEPNDGGADDKKANFLAAQGKENRPTSETVTTFTPEEIEQFKAEAQAAPGATAKESTNKRRHIRCRVHQR